MRQKLMTFYSNTSLTSYKNSPRIDDFVDTINQTVLEIEKGEKIKKRMTGIGFINLNF
jgi:hypothetical protein